MDIFSLLLEREEREREKHINVSEKHRLVAFQMRADWALNPQPSYVP